MLEGVQTFISWENKELSAKEIDVMLESSLSDICIQAVKGKRKTICLMLDFQALKTSLDGNRYDSIF